MPKMKNNLSSDLIYNGVLWKSGEAIEINQTDISDLVKEGHELIGGDE